MIAALIFALLLFAGLLLLLFSINMLRNGRAIKYVYDFGLEYEVIAIAIMTLSVVVLFFSAKWAVTFWSAL